MKLSKMNFLHYRELGGTMDQIEYDEVFRTSVSQDAISQAYREIVDGFGIPTPTQTELYAKLSVVYPGKGDV